MVSVSSYLLGYHYLCVCVCAYVAIGMGYVKNLLSGSQYYYRVQWMGRWRYGAGILPALFFVSTDRLDSTDLLFILCYVLLLLQTLVASVLLRQIHYHIFKFLSMCCTVLFWYMN